MLIRAPESSLLIVDVQERLVPVMTDPRLVIHNCGLLLRAARRLEVPYLVTEQYPKGIGPTIIDLRETVPAEQILEKQHFSCADDPTILAHLRDGKRRQVVVAGIEAHICVLQTALGLHQAGFEVFVVADACSSRRAENHTLAMDRLRAAGVWVVSLEMALFEWMRVSGTPEFKELSALIK